LPADPRPRRSDEELLAVVQARADAVYERRQFGGIGAAAVVTLILALVVAVGGNGDVSHRTVRAVAEASTTTTTSVEDTTTTEATTTTTVTPTTAITAPSSAPTTTTTRQTVPRSVVAAAAQTPHSGPPSAQALVVEVFPPSRDPGRVYVSARGDARNGYVSRMTLTWGDGSPARTFVFPASSCQDPGAQPADDVPVSDDNHAYPSPGTYVVHLLVTATSCDGSASDTATSETTVHYPSSLPSA
jgi:hypothetical protein